ncbi:MAG: YadA-like family protein, partial [Cyanobacteria bacterium]|nr:YadA-like family protein [Cyanobacteriota bacterium]
MLQGSSSVTCLCPETEAGGDGGSVDINGGNNIDVINNGNSTTINWNSAGTPLDCESSGDGAECYGTGAIATGDRTTAIGSNAQSTATGSTTLGSSASASHANATAIGAGAETTRNSQLVLGKATTEITARNLATGRVANNGTEFDMIVANGDGTLTGLRIESGATIDPNSGTISFDGGSTIINEAASIVEEGLNTTVTSSADANDVTTYTVSAYNSATQAGAVADAESTQTASGVTVSSRYDADTQTTTYGIEVATGDGLDINDNGQIEVNTGSNIVLDSNGALNGYKSTVSASDRKITVTTSGGFDEGNDYTTDYAIGLNISDERFNALQCEGDANGAECYGNDAIASAEDTTAIGSKTRATAEESTALGAGAKATQTNSIAIGASSTTTRANQMVLARPQVEITAPSLQRSNSIDVSTNQDQLSTVMASDDGTLKRTNALTSENGKTTINGSNVTLGDENTQVQVPSLSGRGDSLVGVNNDGELFNSSFDPSAIIDNSNQINQNIQQINNNTTNISKNRKDINKLEGAARSLGDAAEAAGAMGAALSGIPEVSLHPDEPVRCGFAGGGFGSQYAVAGGCAARIKDSIHLNGAIAYSPTVDYHYGSTSSLAGRVGFSFPIGGGGSKQSSSSKVQPSGEDWSGNTSERNPETNQQPSAAPPVQPLWYRTEVKQTIAKLETDVSSRDEQIELLKTRLKKLIDDQNRSN